MKKNSTFRTLLVGLLALGATSAWGEEVKTSVYTNDFTESSGWTAKGKTDGWTCNPGTTTANTFNSQVIGVGAGTGDMGLVSPSMSIAEGITIVDVEMKFKMDACTSGKSSGIEFITSDVNINNGYVSAGTPFFAIKASANGNGYWGTITVGGNDYTATLNQTGTYENNSLNRNTTGIITLNARFNFSSKTATYSMSRGGKVIVESTTVTFANTEATTLDRIFIHAGKSYGGVTIDDVKVYSVESEEAVTTYLASFTETNSLNPTITIYSDSERTEEITNGLLENNTTYYYKATLTGYHDYLGSFTVSGENPSVSYTMTEKSTFTYTKRAVCGSEVLIEALATGSAYEGIPVTLTWSKYIKVDEQWYVAKDNTFKSSSQVNATEDVEYEASDISYFFEMEGLTKNGGAYLTEESDKYSNGKRLRLSKGSLYYTSTLEEGVYELSIPWENGNSSEGEVYVYTRNASGELSEALATFKAPKGSGTFTAKIAVPSGYSIAFNGNEGGSSNNNARMDYMTLTKVVTSVTITDAGYATYCSEYALDFSNVEGLTAYTATLNEAEVSFTPVTGAIPANTGVLLKGAEGTYQIPVASSASDVTSALEGVTEATDKEAGIFVLMNGSEGVGFYKTTAASFTVGAHTAYIPALPNTSRSFIAIDEATAIKTIEKTEQSDEIYNLAGQRVKSAQKGLYIIGGKKVVIK